jgi:hypothetical protein
MWLEVTSYEDNTKFMINIGQQEAIRDQGMGRSIYKNGQAYNVTESYAWLKRVLNARSEPKVEE